MGSLAIGSVILIRFPFSDLSQRKLRPAVVLADCGRGDVILCQITGNAYSDSRAIQLSDADFKSGSLHLVSYAKPSKLFTASRTLILSTAGVLKMDSVQAIVAEIVRLLRGTCEPPPDAPRRA